jgi:DNA (cytosine-5)-methyltransferase 1
MENVEGILLGNAIEYSREIYRRFNSIGYKVMHKLLKGEQMGVPQTRHRVFFIATRLDFDLDNVDLNFNYAPIPYAEIKEGKGVKVTEKPKKLLNEYKKGEKTLENAHQRIFGKKSWFTHAVCEENEIVTTISAGHAQMYRYSEKNKLSWQDYRNAQTFPRDYIFDNTSQVAYICGMSVPPIMIKRIVTRLIESGIFKEML